MENLTTITPDVWFSTGIVLGIVIGLTEITKRVLRRFLNEDFVRDFSPIFSILWGVFYSYLAFVAGILSDWVSVIYVGTILGLSASGLWDVGKRSIRGGIIENLKK